MNVILIHMHAWTDGRVIWQNRALRSIAR